MFKKFRGNCHSDYSKTVEELQVINENECKASKMFSAAHVLSENISVSLTLNIPGRFTQIGYMEFDSLSLSNQSLFKGRTAIVCSQTWSLMSCKKMS